MVVTCESYEAFMFTCKAENQNQRDTIDTIHFFGLPQGVFQD